MRLLYRLVTIMLLCLLISCGFHLRGMLKSDSLHWLNHVAIIVEQAHRDFKPLLSEQLNAYHVQVAEEPGHAKYFLLIDHETIQENISSISSSTTPRQYQLTYSVTFRLQRANGVELIPSTHIVVSRQITLNSNRILGSKDEEALETNEMRRDAVLQILNHLSRFSPNTNPNSNNRPKESH